MSGSYVMLIYIELAGADEVYQTMDIHPICDAVNRFLRMSQGESSFNTKELFLSHSECLILTALWEDPTSSHKKIAKQYFSHNESYDAHRAGDDFCKLAQKIASAIQRVYGLPITSIHKKEFISVVKSYCLDKSVSLRGYLLLDMPLEPSVLNSIRTLLGDMLPPEEIELVIEYIYQLTSQLAKRCTQADQSIALYSNEQSGNTMPANLDKVDLRGILQFEQDVPLFQDERLRKPS
jgi:hypothetical protein